MKNIYESIPEYIRNNIKEVNTYANAGNCNKNESKGLLSKDKVFIPGLSEIDNRWENQNKTETGQTLISIFKDKKNRVKKLNNGVGSAEWWWTRSPSYDNSTNFCNFGADGDWYNYSAYFSIGVCVCFNI